MAHHPKGAFADAVGDLEYPMFVVSPPQPLVVDVGLLDTPKATKSGAG